MASCIGSESTPPPPGTTEATRLPLNANPKTADFVVEVQNSIRIQTGGVVVTGGDVGARGVTGPFLSGNHAIDLLTGVQVQATRNVIADSVRLGTGVVVGDVQTNRFTGGTGGSHGSVTPLVPLPALPPLAAVTPGTMNLTVPTGGTVTASSFSFAVVSVGTGGRLRLPAGIYQLRDLTMSAGARVEALGAVQIRISNRLAGTSGAFIGPMSGVPLTAKDIRIEVSGQNGSNGSIGATPKAVAFTSGGNVTALMLVPNGTLQLGTGMVARGAFMARNVDAGGAGAQLIFQDGFPNPCTAESCNDNNPCTNDVCGASGCTHPNAPSGTACSDGNTCTTGDTCQAGSCVGGSPSCGTLMVTKTSTFSNMSPSLSVAVTADRLAVAPADHIIVSATVTNAGVSLSVNGNLDGRNTTGSTAVVQGFQERLEYFSPSQNAWVPLAVAAFNSAGLRLPPTTPIDPFFTAFVRNFGSPGVTYSFISPVAGTSINPGATAEWGTFFGMIIPPSTVTLLRDPQQASAVRVVTRFDPMGSATIGDDGVLDLTAFFTGLPPNPLPGLAVTADLDSGVASAVLTTATPGPLALGASVLFQGELVAPPPTPRDAFLTDEDYLGYLLGLAGQQHSISVQATASAGAFGGAGLSLPSAVPVINVDLAGPADIFAGQMVQYQLALRNDGTGVAGPFTVTDSVDGQLLDTVVSGPATVAPTETANASVEFVAPSNRPGGPFPDQVAVTWKDPNQNIYGPLTKSHTPNLHLYPQGRLTISDVVPQLVGAEVSLTVTVTDALDAPVDGLPIHVVVTGPNARVMDVIAGPDGKVQIGYTGADIGRDAIIASTTIVAVPVSSNVVNVTWVSPVGTPCTGRADPLDIMLVIDASSSMAFEGRLAAAQAASKHFIDTLDFSRDQVGVVSFSADFGLNSPLTTDPVQAKAGIDTIFIREFFAPTNIGAGLTGALDELESLRRRPTATPLIIFLSDGGNTWGEPEPAIARLAASGIRTVTIGLGSDIDRVMLTRIASSLNDYFYAPSGPELEWIYNNVNQNICRNQPPLVRAGGNQGLYSARLPEIVTLNGEVHDDGPDGDLRITSEWTQVSGPAPVAFSDATSPVTQALFTEPGIYVLRLTGTDGFLTTADDATVTIDPAPSLATATLTLSLDAPGPTALGATAVVRALLRDGFGVPIPDFVVAFAVTGVNTSAGNVQTDATGTAVFAYAGIRVGSDRIDATALGGTEILAAAPVFLQWDSAPGSGPALTQGWIGGPVHQSTVSGPISITLGAGVNLTSGSVTYWPMNHPDDVHTLPTTMPASAGATIAALDTTLLGNGPYVIQLAGTDSGGATQVNLVAVTVSGEYKPGRLVVEIEEFKVPLPGLSLAIGRKYDSLERGKVGDFGHGWSLTVGHPDLETDPAHNVTLTEPGGRRVTFAFSAAPYATFFHFLHKPVYTPEAGVFGTLTADGCELLVVNDGRLVCFVDDLEYTPTTYTYTDPFGQVHTMAASGELKSIKDLQGNTLTFTANGITSSSGGMAVEFQRDTAGRITRILAPRTDPFNQNQYLYTYDAAGDLTLVTPAGEFQTFSHSYDPDHRLIRSVDGRGNPARVTTFDANGRLETDTDAMGRVTGYTYDIPARITRRTNPDTGLVVQTFDPRGLLLSETDPLGRTTTHLYDANRNEMSRTNALAETTTFTYDQRGNQTSTTNARGETTSTSFNQYRQPQTGTDALGKVTTIAYDDRFIPTGFSDTLGTLATFTSSSRGLPLSVTDAAGQTTYFVYNAAGNVTAKTDRLGRTTRNTYDGLGHLMSVTDPRGGVTSYTYYPRGTRAWIIGAMGQWTRFDYDLNDSLAREYRPFDPRSTSYAYDAANHVIETAFGDGSHVLSTRDFRGNKLTETDEAGRITTYTYDLTGQLTRTTYPDGTFTARSYDSLGRVASSTDERGGITAYEYEAGCGCAERITKVTDSLARATVTGYDALGRRTSVTDPAGRRTEYSYDARSRLIETRHPDGTSEQDGYDALGRRTTHTDQMAAVTTYGYDAEGQLTSLTDALENVTQYAWDLSGNMVSILDANGHTTTFEYDLSQRKAKRTLPLGQVETFGYDEVANMISHMDFKGKTTTMLHDARSRLLSRTPDASLSEPAETYSYNLTGTRSGMTDAGGATTYTYDLRDRRLTKAAPAGTLSYTYDPSGNVATIRSSNVNGTSVDYAWDLANQLVSVLDNRLPGGLTTTAYAVTGRPSLVTQPSGATATYGYDTMNRIASLAWEKAGAPLATWNSTYSARGQRLTAIDLATGRQAVYGYDTVARLTSETVAGDPGGAGSNGAIQYTLDPTGNRLTRMSALTAIPSATYSYDANDQLTTDMYDANGNTTSYDGATFTYDFRDRLKSKNGGAVTLTHDCDGARVAKTVGAVTTRYMVDELNPTGYSQVLEEVSGGDVKVRYTYGAMLLSQTRNPGGTPQTSFHGHDAHGDITFLMDSTASVTDTYDHDAWGSLIASVGTTPNSRLYAGEELDADLELINLRARQYSPKSGRFLTLDPKMGDPRSPLSLNRYLYANADPANLTDPNGTEAGVGYLGGLAFGAAVVGAATGAYATRVLAQKYYETQDDFPPFTWGPENSDPGPRNKCFKAVLALVQKAKEATSPLVKVGYLTLANIVLAGCGIGNFHP